MRTLEDKVADLDDAQTHMIRAYDLLAKCGYTGLANSMLDLIDEVSTEIADFDLDIAEQEEQE